MWARSASFGSLLLKPLPHWVAAPLEKVLEQITEALKEKADDLPSAVKSTIKIVKLLIDGSIPFEKPVYFLNACPAKVLRGAELAENIDQDTFKELEKTSGAGNILEYDYPLYSAFGVGRYSGLGCSLVRAMKIPSNVASISHDSSVGAEPHNYFSLAFNGATFEQRTPTLFESNNFVAQQIYVMRYPILQTVWGESGFGLKSEDEIRLQVCTRACTRAPVCRSQFSVPSQVLGVNLLREDMIRKKYPASYKDCGHNEDEDCPKGYPGAQKYSEEWNEVMKFTSAVQMFGKSAQEKRSKSLDTKTKAATGGQQNDKECAPGDYAEAAAVKPAKVPDIILGGKRYNCKGGARMHPPPQRPPP